MAIVRQTVINRTNRPSFNDSNNPLDPPPPYSEVSAAPVYSDYQQTSDFGVVTNNQTNIPNQRTNLIILEGSVLTPQTAPGLDHQSTIPCITSSDGGIRCFDKQLDNNPDDLLKFFLSHLKPHRQYIEIVGSHKEYVSTEDGSVIVTKVLDIFIRIDITALLPGWERMTCVPEKDCEGQSFKETLEEYCLSTNPLKELKL